jgi:hypothetical protein
MRPLRFLAVLLSCSLAFFLVLCLGSLRGNTQDNVDESHIGVYFNWRTPSSLFPPSAIISLTDDNSTFFLARPAAFGPLLPTKSLSGQLWVGTGFGDEHLAKSGGEGELGCSDVPGWENEDLTNAFTGARRSASDGKAAGASKSGHKKNKRDEDIDVEGRVPSNGGSSPDEDDGTDDHLHHPLLASDAVKHRGGSSASTKKPAHADIQSLQEGAEIAGKVVLLSRGGCGFLEKAKWVQRRGGVALIVGDDVRGGQLVTMYARGDTSNVTIPALFTSHTTAHLLSSLIPSGGNVDELLPEEAARLGSPLSLPLGDKSESNGKKHGDVEKAVFTTTKAAAKAASTPKSKKAEARDEYLLHGQQNAENVAEKPSGFWSFFGGRSTNGKHEDSRRPPSSGNIDWVLQKDFDEDEFVGKIAKTSTKPANHAPTKKASHDASDGFVIGVQDWRDAGLVAEQKEEHLRKAAAGKNPVSNAQSASKSVKSVPETGPKGGSITPGSGEYNKPAYEPLNVGKSKKPKTKSGKANQQTETSAHRGGWLSRLFSSSEHSHDDHAKQPTEAAKPVAKAAAPESHPALAKNIHLPQSSGDELTDHDGLWITLTPTSMSSSPFFDTLLVLVVSPLVTLTVVYALLLLRSRIRRRRWRAPKSVVERLPVRTYQTMPSTSTSSATSSIASPVSATTPLLPSNAPRPIRPRPRSRTASDVPAGSSSLQSTDPMEEKKATGLAEWRRRYGGKQRECVVCLEEYVDGVSRVMSLPCGHEFHEACM